MSNRTIIKRDVKNVGHGVKKSISDLHNFVKRTGRTIIVRHGKMIGLRKKERRMN